VWFFSDTGLNNGVLQNLANQMTNTELARLAEFMNRGGGVFAVGDHDGLGSQMCGRILHVRTMRKWFAEGDPYPNKPPTAPGNWPADGAERADTLVPNSNGQFYFENQSDNLPQQLVSFSGSSNPLMQTPLG